MKTVLVKYKKRVEERHPPLDDSFESFAKVVEVEKLTDLNNMFSRIESVEILEENDNKQSNTTDTGIQENGCNSSKNYFPKS